MAGNHRSGRPRLPTALHVLRGTPVRDRAHEPVGKPGTPEPPQDVLDDPEALAHWERLSARLMRLRVLTRDHREALAQLAHALAADGRVRAQLRAMNYQRLVVDEIRDKAGNVRRRVRDNPLIRQSIMASELVRRLLGEFGLTPITQAKVHAQPSIARTRASRYITSA